MRVLVFGGGAVGLGIASCLIKSGVEVHILARPDTAAALKRHGLKRTGIFGAHNARKGDFFTCLSLSDVKDTSFSHVLICTKSFDTRAVARNLKAEEGVDFSRSKFVLFQNGWGNTEIFQKSFQPERIFNARVITGFTRPEKHIVVVTVHAEDIHIGSFLPGKSHEITELCQVITRGGIPCGVTDTIKKDLWAKMLYNCALNSLGAIFEVTYGELGARSESRRIMNTIIREIFSVIDAEGFSTCWKNPDEYLDHFYGNLIPPTNRHFSSTLQDIKAGKKTEIDALNGAVIRLAEAGKIPVPVNTVVYNMVKFKETSQRRS